METRPMEATYPRQAVPTKYFLFLISYRVL